MLTQVFKPQFHEKSLDHPSFNCGVFEYSPRIRTITPPLTTKVFKRGKEWFAVVGIDPIFDRDQHFNPILLDLVSDDGVSLPKTPSD